MQDFLLQELGRCWGLWCTDGNGREFYGGTKGAVAHVHFLST